jgi:copper chaperone CopZ
MDETNTELATIGPHSTATMGDLWETKTIGVTGMTSDKCVKKIERAFRRHPGVKDIQIDRESATATISFDARQTNMPELHELLLHSGYKPSVSVASGNRG